MTGMLIMLYLSCVFTQVEQATDRLAAFDRLNAEYEAAVEAHYAQESSEEVTDLQRIELYQAWPGWEYLPKFIDVIEENVDDEAALKSCQWIIERCGNIGNSGKAIFDADRIAWEVISARHRYSPELPLLCLQAVRYPSPAREQFLRRLPDDWTQPVEVHGFSILALAELLAQKYEFVAGGGLTAWPEPRDEVEKYMRGEISPEWKEYMTVADPEKLRQESCELFQEVLDHYADVPVTISAPYFRDLKTLGEKAKKSLHALENLRVGLPAPPIAGTDLNGKPLKLADYRGKVVVLSFWFTGCGPCMALVPEEQKLVETYRGQPFALLGICGDAEIAEGLKTATEKEISWPCLFDGDAGPIHADYNILSWPTLYLIDSDGKIVAKDVPPGQIEAAVAKLMEKHTLDNEMLSGN